MLGSVSSLQFAYRLPALYRTGAARPVHANAAVEHVSRRSLVRGAQTGTPVTPVTAVPPARDATFDQGALLNFLAYDPVERAVRGRITYLGNGADARNAPQAARNFEGDSMSRPGDAAASDPTAVPFGENAAPGAAELPGQDGPKIAGLAGESEEARSSEKTKSAQEVAEEAECQTCKERKYQDGSDDPGVSFKSPAHIDPDMAGAMVRGHENEHVVRERAKADQEDRKVVSQSVTYHTAICPECGRVYVSGGTTRTVTAGQTELPKPEEDTEDGPFSAVA